MKFKYYIGIDVSALSLDICLLDKNKKESYYKIPNSQESIKSFFNSFKNVEICVCFETTANYSINLSRYLSNLKIPYNELNPQKASLFLRHLSNIKTDKTDSYGLALYITIFKNDIVQSKYNHKYKLIKCYSSTSKLLVKIQTQLKNFEKSQISLINDEILSIINVLKTHIKLLIKKLDDIVYDLISIEIPQTKDIIKDNKGFGKSLAITLFPILHFNSSKNSKEIISYLGLSPKIYESGSSVKKREHITKTGNNEVRRILFMNALSCIRYNEIFQSRYERLVARGKPKKVAITAVMCAIIRYLKSKYFNQNLDIFNDALKSI